MLLNSKTFIPEVYARERDMQVFTTLIDLLINANKFDIDGLYRLYVADECPEVFLPELAQTLNYVYDGANTVASNRKIIGIFMTMMRYKGCEIGLKMATALCLTSLDLSIKNLEMEDVGTSYINALSHLDISYDYEQGIITIDYPNIYTQVRYLLDYVRPVGMTLNIRSVVNADTKAYMGILAQTVTKVAPYTEYKSTVNTSVVNFSTPVAQDWLDIWNEDFPDSTLDLNN